MNLEFLMGVLNDPTINISDVSRETGISKVSLYNIKNGKQIPTAKNYAKICKYFSERDIIKSYPEMEKCAKELQEEILKTGKDIIIVVSAKTIGQLENFKIY